MKTISSKIITAIVLFLISTYRVNGQNSVSVQVTGTVLDPVMVTSSTGMDFGEDILPGIPLSISRLDGNAAKFSMISESGNFVGVNFSLPEMLYHDSEEDEMPIIFGTQDASLSTTDEVAGSSTFDPNIETSHLITGGGNFYIWLGGTLNPRNDQMAGTYSGDITIDLSYVEN